MLTGTGWRRATDVAGSGGRPSLYAAIGEFLSAQRLEPNPTNYAFAYTVLIDPSGALARAVGELTEGGVRLTRADMATLNAQVDLNATSPAAPAPDPAEAALVERTQRQVEGLAGMIGAMRTDTMGFGQDLADSAEQIRQSRDGAGQDLAAGDRLATIVGGMLVRVERAERDLERAVSETDELRSALAEARTDARRDTLTQLPNRRAFEEAFAAAAGQPRALAILDVDHFKSVNDNYGHGVGDRVLKAIARTLADTCDGDLVARHGGEEFLILFVGAACSQARVRLDAAREAVGARRYRLRETDKLIEGVTISAGLVQVAADEALATATKRADALLYRAKKGGRDQTLGD